MQELNVHFVNRGFKTDSGIKTVKLVELGLCQFTGRPEAKIENPWWSGETLRAQFENNEWLCD